MNGMSRFWIGAAWYQFYWSACATLLAVLAYGLWRRGTADALRPRLAALPRCMRGPAGAIGGGAIVLWLGSGAWIFWNTNVLNQYLPAPERERLLADAEKALLPFENLPQPSITQVVLDVQLFPGEARVVTRGSYRVENRTAQPIDELHVGWGERLKIDELALAGAVLQKSYERFNHRIYRLQPALQPGEAREMRFTTTLAQQGFADGNSLGGLQQTAEGRPLTRVVDNGSFIDNTEISPFLGFSRQGLLTDRAKRRKYGLPPDLRPPRLEVESGRQKSEFRADGDWVTADITVSTDADQTPIAPGTLLSDTTNGSRRTAHFRTDAPINHFFSIQSARYEVRRDKLGDIDLAVYFHPGHDVNVDRMIKAMKVSLALFGEQFSPYQFKQARILEFPSYARFAQSFANTIPYSEDIGFLSRLAQPEQIDVVTFVTAHEIAHQWWAHQLVPSEQQGASMLVESFAQYSALLVMERIYGKEQMRRFLKYELDKYLRGRGGEVVEELPLARVEEQRYIHYQKGALTMYWLKEVVGEAVVNRALSRLLKQFAFKAAPYPNSTDFLRILREEAGAQHEALIADLFERITLLDVKAVDAKATKRADGTWELSFEVEARKLYADGKGKETDTPLNEPFDIGVFTVEPGRKGYSAASILSFDRQTIRTGKQTLRLVVNQEPKFVGVDPFNKRIDRNSEDNITSVAGS
jgi:hypothetical protein